MRGKNMGKIDIPKLPELPELPLPSASDIEGRIDTLVSDAVAKPAGKIVSKIISTPAMVIESVVDGLQKASK